MNRDFLTILKMFSIALYVRTSTESLAKLSAKEKFPTV